MLKCVHLISVDWTGAISYYRTIWKSRVREELVGKLDIPLLLIMGDGDKSFSLEAAIKSTEIEQKLVVRLVNGAGHAPHQQAAPLVNKLLLTFLSGILRFGIVFLLNLQYFLQFLRAKWVALHQFLASLLQPSIKD